MFEKPCSVFFFFWFLLNRLRTNHQRCFGQKPQKKTLQNKIKLLWQDRNKDKCGKKQAQRWSVTLNKQHIYIYMCVCICFCIWWFLCVRPLHHFSACLFSAASCLSSAAFRLRQHRVSGQGCKHGVKSYFYVNESGLCWLSQAITP